MANNQHRYLQLHRLVDILAAIQTMSLHDKYRHTTEGWADLISGNKEMAAHWKQVFDEHPEFFRKSATYAGQYGLVWRRALKERGPVPENQIKTLLDTAIELHQREIDAFRDWRWWVAPVLAVFSSFIGAVLGGLLRHYFS